MQETPPPPPTGKHKEDMRKVCIVIKRYRTKAQMGYIFRPSGILSNEKWEQYVRVAFPR